MSVKTHYTATATFTPASWVRTCRVVAAGEQGAPYQAVPPNVSSSDGGTGAILSAVFPVSGPFAVSVGSIAGGAAVGNGGRGGNATKVFDLIAAAGGGSGWEYQSGVANGWRSGGGWAAAPGQPGGDGQRVYTDDTTSMGRGGGAAGAGGAGGTAAGSTAGTAGQPSTSGGTGGAGASRSAGAGGSGGGGFGGGGGGTVYVLGSDYVGSGGGAGSSTYGSGTSGTFVDRNWGAAWADVYVAGAPKVPTSVSATGNSWQDRTKPIPLTFVHNPDTVGEVIDAQTDAQVQYRPVQTPAAAWTTVTAMGTATTYQITAGALAVGQYEWQARTKADGTAGDDTSGIWGPWSTSEYFQADTPPAPPVVSSPASGAVIGAAVVAPVWSAPGQVEWEARLVGDSGGVANPNVLYDSKSAADASTTTTLAAATNHVSAHVQVRIRTTVGGLWSAWADVPVSIEWAGPPKPRVTLAVAGIFSHQIYVTVTNPAPVGVEPVADRIEVYVIEGDMRERRAILTPGAGWIYETPPSRMEIGIEAVAIFTPTNVQTSSGVIF